MQLCHKKSGQSFVRTKVYLIKSTLYSFKVTKKSKSTKMNMILKFNPFSQSVSTNNVLFVSSVFLSCVRITNYMGLAPPPLCLFDPCCDNESNSV